MDTAQQPHALNELFACYPDSVLMVNLCDEILYANPPALRLLCRLPDYQGYLPPVLRVLNGQHQPLSLHDIADNEIIVEIKCQNVVWQDSHVKLLTLCDRTRLIQRQRELEKLVYCDELTGLYNRRGLDAQVKRLQLDTRHLQQKYNVLFIDVNGLKQINDTLGHRCGDAALLETGEVIRLGFGGEAIKARIGGDEFAVLQREDPQRPVQDCIDVINNCLNRLNNQLGRAYRLSLSIGISQYFPGHVFDFQQLMQLADQNMYRAKAESDVLQPSSVRQQKPALHVVALTDADNAETATIYA